MPPVRPQRPPIEQSPVLPAEPVQTSPVQPEVIQGPPGNRGPPGEQGPQGPAYQPTEQDYRTIVAAVIAGIRENPEEFKGPKGDPAKVDYEKLTAEVIRRLPKLPLQFLDASGNVADEQSVTVGEPFKIPALRVRSYDRGDPIDPATGEPKPRENVSYVYTHGIKIRYGEITTEQASPSGK